MPAAGPEPYKSPSSRPVRLGRVGAAPDPANLEQQPGLHSTSATPPAQSAKVALEMDNDEENVKTWQMTAWSSG